MSARTVIQQVLGFPFTLRQARLAQRRRALTETDFVRRIANEGGDAAAASLIWRHLMGWVYVDGFTPYPDDDLGTVFGIAEEELDEDFILGILHQTGVPTPSNKLLADFGVVETPLRVAQLVARCRHQ